MAGAGGPTREAMGFLVEGIPVLSKSAREFVVQHPREARLAVAVALETAAAQREADDGGIDVPKRLQTFIVRRTDGEDTIGASEAAARLGVSRTTVYDWVQRGTLLAWKSTRRGLNIPAAQILGPGAVVAGLADVVGVIEDPELAWSFLTQEWPFEDAVAKPLDLLKSGRVAEVLNAAPGFGDTFT